MSRMSRPRGLAQLTALAVLVGLFVAPTSVASAAPPRPDLPRTAPVPGSTGKVRPRPADQASRAAWRSVPRVSWPTPGAATVDVAATGAAAGRAGTLPVTVSAASTSDGQLAGAARTVGTPPSRVRLELLDRQRAERSGVDGLLFRLGRVDGVSGSGRVHLSVDYTAFRHAYGGDWGSRLRLVALPACAEQTPETAACRAGVPLPTRNDTRAARLDADVTTSDATSLFAVAAGTSGSAGDFGASSLSPSASWDVSEQTGDFNWTYPIDTPDGPGGPEPDIDLTYSSGRVDGRTASTNNQASWVGEGLDFWPGYVERRYNSCTDDGVTPKVGDLCWGPADNATLMLGGSASELVRDSTGVWHLKSDDGSRIERLTGATNGDNDGEHWKLTAADGTQYFFGLNRLPGWAAGNKETASTWTVPVYGDDTGEPCKGSTFGTSWCQQGWRWNVDYVVDTHGNAMSYWYSPETNYYARGATSTTAGTATKYTRGGYLGEISYGQRSDTLFTTTAPYRVVFNPAERCLANCGSFTKAYAANWPDVPFDVNCEAGATCTSGQPTFWTRKRLASIVTQVYRSPAYSDVETWTLTHNFPDTGDGTSPTLWLSTISRTGNVGGTLALGDVTLSGVQLPNRVDTTEGLPPLTKWRVSAVTDEAGGALSVSYSGADCVAGQTPAPDSNTKRCFPQYWTPDGAIDPKLDWFHKYVVTQIADLDTTGGAPAEVTNYAYLDAPAWHYDDDPWTVEKNRTWGQWRGYSKVRVYQGDASNPARGQTDMLFFRGMDGDRLAAGGTRSVTVTDSQGTALVDAPALQGFQREETDYTGAGGTVAETEITTPWTQQTASQTRAGLPITADMVREASSVTRTALASGGWLVTQTDTAYDTYGMPTQVDDKGDVATSSDDTCTRTTYLRNATAGILDTVSRVEAVAVGCAATPNRPADVLSDVRTSYDGQSFGLAPTMGDESRSEVATGYSGGSPVYRTDSVQTYDAIGRVLTETDPSGAVTSTTYTPAVGGPVTQTVETNALGHTATTVYEPAWGVPVSETDANGRTTTAKYDPLGRATGVWLPGRDPATQTANVTYGYQIRSNGATSVATSTLRNDGTYTTTYELYDAQLRPRQTQEPAQGGGRIITDTVYDDRGLVVKENQEYYTDGSPSGDLFVPATDADVPGQTRTVHDGLGRPTTDIFLVRNVEKWRGTITYGGDRETVVPPGGAGAVTRISDARDNLVELRQYQANTPTGAYDTVRYSWTPDGELASVTDAAGNVRRYTYDLLGRKTMSQEPDAGTITYGYDNRDLLTSTTDGRGRTLAYTYDALGRRTAQYDGSTSGTKLAEWTWDTLARGQLTRSTRYVNGLAYVNEITSLNTDYQVTGSRITIPDAGGTAGKLAGVYNYSADYNLDGTLKRSSFPAAGGLAAETMLMGYDELSEPTTLHGAIAYVTGATYSKLGLLSRRSLAANGHVWQRDLSYEDGTNRLARIQDTRDVAPYTLTDRRYDYDPTGNIRRIADTPSDTAADTQCFRYDHLQRLTEAWTATDDCAGAPTSATVNGPAPYWQSFSYGADGNRLSRTDHATAVGGTDVLRGYAYPAAGAAQPHAVKSVTTSGGARNGQVDQYTYDAAGNTVTRTVDGQTQTLTWDAEGSLATATVGGRSSSYLYDADGALLVSQDADGATLYLPDQEVRVSSTGVLSGERYYTHGGEVVAVRSNTGLSWLLADPQGTSSVAVDTTTMAVSRRYYAPFGDARGTPTGTFPSSHGYVGGTSDRTTGLLHLGAREYDPTLGRFVSVDPLTVIDDPQELDGYSYAANNPVVKSDPDGTCWICNKVRSGVKRLKKKASQARKSWNRFTNWGRKQVRRWVPPSVRHWVSKKVKRLRKIVHSVRNRVKHLAKRFRKAVAPLIRRIRKSRFVRHVRQAVRRIGRGIRFDPGGKRAPHRKPTNRPAPKPSPEPEGGNRPVTPEDYYVAGNMSGVKPSLRASTPDRDREYKPDADGNIPPYGGYTAADPGGISAFTSLAEAKRKVRGAKAFWKIPKGTPIPEGYAWVHDGAARGSSHWTFYNTRTVSPEAMRMTFVNMGQWQGPILNK